MNMDKNDSFDGPLQEGRHTTLRSFSWGNREFTISSDKISLYVGGIPYDTKPMLDILRGSGVDPGNSLPPGGSLCSGGSLHACRVVKSRSCCSKPHPDILSGVWK
ncbi:hypothetical protein NXV68_10150 [Bacteroides fragilis]|nr:hypothetical protein [Bacteroides fragilis]